MTNDDNSVVSELWDVYWQIFEICRYFCLTCKKFFKFSYTLLPPNFKKNLINFLKLFQYELVNVNVKNSFWFCSGVCCILFNKTKIYCLK